MSEESRIIHSEIADVAEIVRNECWLEGQRRGCAVAPTDDFVRQRVADIILGGAGEYMRRRHSQVGEQTRKPC